MTDNILRDTVTADRAALWANGYRPLAVKNAVTGDPKSGKAPAGDDWTGRARSDPPPAAEQRASARALNTGILSDDLVAVDIDLDVPALAKDVRAQIETAWGDTIVRVRSNSARCLLVYRSDGGANRKQRVVGAGGKVEFLGHGQQFVAFGGHHSGVDLAWEGESPLDRTAASLPVVTAEQVAEMQAAIASMIGAEVAAADRAKASDKPRSNPSLQAANMIDVALALAEIPNDGPADWEHWNQVGLEVHAATGGSAAGLALWRSWSCVHPDHDDDTLNERWEHFHGHALARAGMGSLVHRAMQANPAFILPTKLREVTASDFDSDLDETPDPVVAASPAASDASAIPLHSFLRGQNPYGDRRWLVHEALPETGVAFLAGQYAAGKTFVALDLAYSVMTGEPFAGMDVDRTGGVLFMAAEGEAEIPVRLEAILRARKAEETAALPFVWIDQVPELLGGGSKQKLASVTRRAAERFKAENLPLALIIVDTVAAAAGWTDENNAAEAQEAIRILQAMAKMTGALVVAIDHHGKDQAAGVRGSTAKSAGAEAVLAVLGDKQVNGQTANKRLALHKVRGGASGREIPFELPQITLGADERRRPVTSCVVEWQTTAPANAVRVEPALKPIERAFLDCIKAVLTKMPIATEAALCDACDDAGVSSASERKARDRTFREVKRRLVDKGLVHEAAGVLWLTGSGADEFGDLELESAL